MKAMFKLITAAIAAVAMFGMPGFAATIDVGKTTDGITNSPTKTDVGAVSTPQQKAGMLIVIKRDVFAQTEPSVLGTTVPGIGAQLHDLAVTSTMALLARRDHSMIGNLGKGSGSQMTSLADYVRGDHSWHNSASSGVTKYGGSWSSVVAPPGAVPFVATSDGALAHSG